MRISDWSSDVCSSDLFIGQYLGQQRINPLPQLSLRHDHDDLPILGNFQERAHDMLALGCLQIGRIAARPKAPGEQQPRTRAAADKQLATGQPLWFFFTARHALHGRVIEWDCAGWKAYCGSEDWQPKRGSVSLPGRNAQARDIDRSEEHTSELQSLMRI